MVTLTFRFDFKLCIANSRHGHTYTANSRHLVTPVQPTVEWSHLHTVDMVTPVQPTVDMV